MRENIERDYRENDLPEPDVIFGWEQPPEQRKPHTWPLEQIMERFSLAPQELLVVDDLKPGYDMAKAAGVPLSAAGWANDIPEIEQFMRKNCDFYCEKLSPISTGFWKSAAARFLNAGGFRLLIFFCQLAVFIGTQTAQHGDWRRGEHGRFPGSGLVPENVR